MDQERWQRAYEPAPEAFELSIERALWQAREGKNVRRFTLRTVAIAVSIIAVLTGVSLALARSTGAPDFLAAGQPRAITLEIAPGTPSETNGTSDEELIEDATERQAAFRALGTAAPVKKPQMKLYAFTVPGAEIEILSDHVEGSLDLTRLNTDGSFSFIATFPTIGDNEVVIRARRGSGEAALTHAVYYVPPANVYIQRAWPCERGVYADLLGNSELRRGQVYACKGTVTEIVGECPQLAVMDTGTGEAEQLVLLENNSNITWEAGQHYRVYGDASGLYETMPRLTVRFTYLD